MQPYSVAHLRQNIVSQPQASSQSPNVALTAGQGPHRLPDVRPNKPMSGKLREADPASSRIQLQVILEDLETNEERGLGPSSSARSSQPVNLIPSAISLSLGATNSVSDIYRWPEPLPHHSYPYSYHYSTPSASPSKTTLIPPKITLNSPSSSSTGHDQAQNHITTGSPSKSLGSAVLQIHPTSPSQSHPSPQAVSPQRQRSRDYVNHNLPIPRRNHGIAPLTSDARTEHILLAARRIGRERAGLVAGIKQHAEHEIEKHARELDLIKARQDHERLEKERLERLANGTSGLAYYRSTDVLSSPQRNTGRGSAVPRTPKRGGGVGATHYPALSGALSNSPISSPTRMPASAGPSTFVFVNTSAVAGTSGYSGAGILSTPDQLGSVQKRSSTARGGSRNLPSNPPTPLDSLLDAARSMMDDRAGAGEKACGKINCTRKASEHPESPVPKRRRVSSSVSKTLGRGGGLTGSSTVTRVRSALDVLADQAAAAFNDDPAQTRRGPNTRGKGKEKLGDESLSGGSDGGVDDVQKDDPDDSWPQGSASASSMGPSRGRSRTKINTRPTAEPSTSSMSLRPVRQASQKRLASQDLQPPPSVSITAARRQGKSRGRPKGSKSPSRSTASAKTSSTLKMNPSLGPRVIASVPTYSPLDEAVALLPPKSKRREEDRSEEHPQWTTIDIDPSPSMGSPRLRFRPVVDWGERDVEEDDEVEDIEGEGEYVSLVVAVGLDQENDHIEGNLDADAIEVSNDKMTTESTPGSTVKIMEQVMDAETQIDTLSNAPTHDISPADVDPMTIPPVDNVANAEADLDDEDAEGEQEEDDDENGDADAEQDQSSRSRTPPPPPDPPHFGKPSNSNNDDPDADADADGEMEFEENGELPPTSTSSTVYQTALSVPMGEVPPGNFDGSFLAIIFWIKSEKSFGCNTTSAHVLIPAMASESLFFHHRCQYCPTYRKR